MQILTSTKVLLKNLIRKPSTLAYPAAPRPYYPRTRGHIEIDLPACVYCGMCQRKCPTGAIEVRRAETTWSIERLKCIQCNSCVEVCPKKCLTMAIAPTPAATGAVKDIFDARVSDRQAAD